MILFSRVRMATYRRWSLLLLGVSIFLLAIVWIPHIGVVGGGARRWLSLGFTTFQPSEIAKIAVVLFFSSMICTYKDQMQTIRYGVVPFMVITGGIVILLMLEPHLSASIIIMALAIVMMFVGGIKLSYLLIGMGGAGALLLIAGKFVPYVHKRIVSWRDPFADTSAAGYQIVQSLYSIGSGGFLGLGLGQSRQKYLYLPEEHNDYIFSIVCEELGYVGAVAILILVRAAHLPRLLDRRALARPLQLSRRRRHHDAAVDPGVSEHRGRHESHPLHRHLAAVFQLRRARRC